jgi:hypothetical protein
LPDLDVAIRFTDRPDARLNNINLTVEEWRVVSFVNPRNTIRQIAKANNLSEFEIRRIVYGMLQAGLVEFVDKPRPTLEESDTPRRRKQSIDQPPDVKRSVVERLIDRIKSI